MSRDRELRNTWKAPFTPVAVEPPTNRPILPQDRQSFEEDCEQSFEDELRLSTEETTAVHHDMDWRLHPDGRSRILYTSHDDYEDDPEPWLDEWEMRRRGSDEPDMRRCGIESAPALDDDDRRVSLQPAGLVSQWHGPDTDEYENQEYHEYHGSPETPPETHDHLDHEMPISRNTSVWQRLGATHSNAYSGAGMRERNGVAARLGEPPISSRLGEPTDSTRLDEPPFSSRLGTRLREQPETIQFREHPVYDDRPSICVTVPRFRNGTGYKLGLLGDSPVARYSNGTPPRFGLPQPRMINTMSNSNPQRFGLPQSRLINAMSNSTTPRFRLPQSRMINATRLQEQQNLNTPQKQKAWKRKVKKKKVPTATLR